MVRKMEYMGEVNSSHLMRRIDKYLIGVFHRLPFAYLSLLREPFVELIGQNKKITVLDLGCGDGTATENLGLSENFEITGVDIFSPYLKLAKRKKIYKKLIRADIDHFNPKKKYDIVMAMHVLEHLRKKAGSAFLKRIETFAKDKVLVVAPIGILPQSEYDQNSYQVHVSSWSPKEMINRGYKVKSQGLKILWGNKNVVAKYGVFSYLLFLVSAIFTPFLRLRPEIGTYMVCVKSIKK